MLVPDRCKVQDFPAGLEKCEELVRRYERTKSSGTMTKALDDDINTAALEARVPSELEQHFVMNRARLITYEQVRSETQAYTKARRGRFAFKTVATKRTSHQKEVYSFGNGSKKGKNGKGVGLSGKKEGQRQDQNPNPSKDVVCWHYGKKSHLAQNIGRIQKIHLIPVELKTKEAKENRRTAQAREQARWSRENMLQWWSRNRSQLLRALY